MRERKTTSPLRMMRCGAVRRILALCLLVCFLLAAGTSFASYLSTGGAEDGARVAKGAISVEYAGSSGDVNEDGTVLIRLEPPSDDAGAHVFGFGDFDFDITSSSEVAIEYDIIVKVTKNGQPVELPDGVMMILGGDGYDQAIGAFSSGEYVFKGGGAFDAAAESSERYKLAFKADYPPINDNYGPFDVEIVVDARQID